MIRAQYIHSEESLYREILSTLQNKEALILESIEILESQKNKISEGEAANRFLGTSQEDSKILAAGFYSWNESEDLEKDLSKTGEEVYYFQHSYDIQRDPNNTLAQFGKISSYMNFSGEHRKSLG